MYTYRSLLAGVLYDLPSGVDITMGFELSDISGATIKYPTNGVNADKVVEDATIIAYYNGVELQNGRWWLLGSSGEEITDDAPFKTIAGKNLFHIFDKTVVHTNSTGKLDFAAKNPGQILITLFQAAQARGAMTGVTWDFTATTDSDGLAWPDTYDISFSITDSYLKVIQGMFDNAWAEFAWNGTVFRAFKPFGAGTDLSATINLIGGRDYVELPYKISIEDRVHYALVAGDEGTQANHYAVGSPTGPYGREEIGATQGGVESSATLGIFAFNIVRDNNKNARENTRKLIIGPNTPVPGSAFNVGDTINEIINGVATAQRVKSIAIGVDSDGTATASIVLGDRIYDSDIQAARARNALSGSVRTSGGTGTPAPIPPTTVADTNTPNAPTGLASFTDGYLDSNGYFRAYVTLSWAAPTTNTDASALTDLAGYEVQYQLAGQTTWRTVRVTDASTTVADLQPGYNYNFRVRATDNASPPHLSAWSTTLVVATATDNIAPPVPKTPTSITSRGTAMISWNGKSNIDGTMGVDFAYVLVHRSQTNNFTPNAATLIGQMSNAGTLIFDDQAYGVTWYYKLIAYDTTGNASAASAQVAATTQPLVTGDLADLSVTVGKLASNSVNTDKLVAGSVNGLILTGDAIDGKTITGAILRTNATGERIVIEGGGASTANEIRYHVDDVEPPSVIRGNAIQGSSIKRLGVESPIKFYANASVPQYYQTILQVGDTSDLGNLVPGIDMYVLGGASPATWDTGSETPTAWMQMYDDRLWFLADDRITFSGTLRAADMGHDEDFYSDTTAMNITNTTTGTAVGARGGGTSFVAPPSGRVAIFFTALVKAPADGQYVSHGIEVKTGSVVGSGTAVETFSYTLGAESYNLQFAQTSKWRYITGLTAGAFYNTRQICVTQSGTAQFARGTILIMKSL